MAVEGVKDGANDARAAASRLISAAQQALAKGVYRTCYGISYGAVYGAMLVSSMVPTDNAMGEGLKRGAECARNAFRKHHEKRAVEEEMVGDHDLDDTVVGVAA